MTPIKDSFSALNAKNFMSAPDIYLCEAFMDKKKIWEMSRLAMFEEEDGREDLSVAFYYKRDYVALGLLSNFLLISIAYVIIVAGIILYKLDYLTENFSSMDYSVMIAAVVIFYFLLLGIYSAIVFTLRSLRHAKAKRRVQEYYDELNDLLEVKENEAYFARKKKRRQQS